MRHVGIVAFGAVSALGEGAAAVRSGECGEAARSAIDRDDELVRAGLSRPFAARVRSLDVPDGDERAAGLLGRALATCSAKLDRLWPGWRRQRVGLVLGTSSGGLRAAERAFADIAADRLIADVHAPTYFAPVDLAARGLGLVFAPSVLVLGACASGTLAIGLGKRWLERDACDLVLAGGFDEVTVFVAAGFEALRATTAAPPPRPFRVGRDGMALGEGAAVVALARADGPPARAFITGFGAGSDACHLTAPDRSGGGLARATRRALEEAGRPIVDLVSAHATATPLNDSAEFAGLSTALGADLARRVVVHPFKAQIGHTMGAAGALELLASMDALERSILPAAAGEGALDPAAPARLLRRAIAATPSCVLKVSSAFGGANAALVVTGGRDPSRPCAETLTMRGPLRPVFVGPAIHVREEPDLDDLAAHVGLSPERLARGDALVRLALAAVARLRVRAGPLGPACGVVVGSALATVETNALFAARVRERGAVAAEPRRFPYTSPNAVAGECSIAFGLTGPSFAVGGGRPAALEALACGALLVEAGDAEAIVVVGVDDIGPVARRLGGRDLRSGAVALLVRAAASPDAQGRIGEITLRLRPGVDAGCSDPAGHLALLALVAEPPVSAGAGRCELTVGSSTGSFARIVIDPL